VAKSVGVEAVTYTDQPQSAVADRKAAEVAFQMTAGQVSDAVQGDFKTVVIKVVSITPGQAPDINAARPQIAADIQMQEALDKVYDETQKFEDLVQGGATVQDAASKLGLTPVTVGPLTADGKDITTGQPVPAVTPKLLTSAFQLAQGAQSDGVEQDADKGEYYFVHVDQVTAPSPPGLGEPGVRERLTQAYYQQAVVTALKKMGDDAQAALGKGQTMQAVAATYHAQVAHQLAMTRVAAQQLEQTLGQEFLAAAFGAKANANFVAGSDPLKGLVVGHVDAIHPGDPKQVATMLEQLRQQSAQHYMESLDEATRQASVRLLHPQTDLKLAHQVMGVDDAMLQRVNHPATNSASHLAQ
jgi:peptidyl-prolyl cis-trans isomerase D